MPGSIETALASALADSSRFGQVLIRKKNGAYILSHRDDESGDDLHGFQDPDDAAEIARYDDEGNYRPLKTAPNLRHGWRLEVIDLAGLQRALDYFYPGRLAMFAAWRKD